MSYLAAVTTPAFARRRTRCVRRVLSIFFAVVSLTATAFGGDDTVPPPAATGPAPAAVPADSDAGSPAQAPAPAPPPSDAAAAPQPLKIGDVTVSGSVRAREYFWSWFTPSSGDNKYNYSGDYLHLAFSENLTRFNWIAEFNVPVILGLPSNPNGPGTQGALGLGSNYLAGNSGKQNAAMIFPRQLNVTFKDVVTDTSTLQVGRFTFGDGTEITPKDPSLATLKATRVAQRLLGDFGFTDVGRSFDGFHYSLLTPDDNVTVVTATPTRGVFQTDGWGWNRVGFGYAAYTHEWGSNGHNADTRFFVIDYDDFRHITKTDNRPLAVRKLDLSNIHIQTYGAHSLHTQATPAGTLDFLFWGAVQAGRWGPQIDRAYAYVFQGGWQPKIPVIRPWLQAGLTHTTGDNNPNDGKHGTFFQILPTPRVYARFPFFNMMNINDEMGSLVLRPLKKVTTSSEFHSLKLSSGNDLWYAGGGAYQPWTFGFSGRATGGATSLGDLWDTNVEYRFNRYFTFTGYLGYLEGMSVMRTIYPAGKDARMGLVEVLFKF